MGWTQIFPNYTIYNYIIVSGSLYPLLVFLSAHSATVVATVYMCHFSKLGASIYAPKYGAIVTWHFLYTSNWLDNDLNFFLKGRQPRYFRDSSSSDLRRHFEKVLHGHYHVMVIKSNNNLSLWCSPGFLTSPPPLTMITCNSLKNSQV